MMVRGAFNALLRPMNRKAFRDAYQEIPTEYNMFLREGTQDGPYVEAITMGGLPRMVRRGEAEPVTYIDPWIGDKVEYVDDEYALGFIVSRRLMEDDQYGKVKQNSRWLGRSARLTQEYAAAAFLDDAFTGNIYKGMNGEALISTAHTLQGPQAGTVSNRLAVGTQLSVTGIQAAYDLAATTRDPDGNPIPWTPSRLIIGITDEWRAIELTQSQLEPFTSDNTVNAIRFKPKKVDYKVSHYKNQNGNWMFIDPNILDAWFLFRLRPEFHDTMDFDTFAAKFAARQRINVYFFDWRGTVGASMA